MECPRNRKKVKITKFRACARQGTRHNTGENPAYGSPPVSYWQQSQLSVFAKDEPVSKRVLRSLSTQA